MSAAPAADPTAPFGYATSAEHLEAELGRLDLILRLQVDRPRPVNGEIAEPALLHWLDEVGAEIGRRVAATSDTVAELRLVALAELFDLTPFEVDVIVFCFAAEIDERYERIYSRLCGGPVPTAGFVLDALCPDVAARLAARSRLTGSAPLLRHGLVVPSDSRDQLGTALRLDQRILCYLLEADDRLPVPDDAAPLRSAPVRRITPRHGWDALVLPDEQLEQLHEIVARIVLRPLVHEAWSFGPRGLNVLFTGPPGTGKTLAVEVLARGAGWDIHKIDLSAVTTAADLGRAFDEAAAAHAVLFMDQADALLGPADLLTGSVLQKMEEHDGVVVLETHRRENLDERVVHRLHAAVEFPLPAAPLRRRIWELVWPEVAPRAADLDLALLADEVALPGGSIRTIAAASAFLAAADDGVVSMRHVVRAVRREYQKKGESGFTAAPGCG